MIRPAGVEYFERAFILIGGLALGLIIGFGLNWSAI